MKEQDYLISTQKRRIQYRQKIRQYGSILFWFIMLVLFAFKKEYFIGVFLISIFTYLLVLLLLSIRIEIEKQKLEHLLHQRMKDL